MIIQSLGQDEAPRSGAVVDTDLLVRAALFLSNNVIKYGEVEKRSDSAKASMFKGVQSSWANAADGIEQAVSIFKNAGIPDGSWIQYRYALLPPAIWMANGKEPKDGFWIAWTVLACLWGQYSGSAETKVQADAIVAKVGDAKGLLENLRNTAKRTESLIPDVDDFTEQVVQSQGVILALLLHLIDVDARSLFSGKRIKTLSEPLEVHHIFPRAYLNKNSSETRTFQPDRLGNLTVLYRADNEHILDMPPCDSLAECCDDDLVNHCIPLDGKLWSLENYEEFCTERERLMAEHIGKLLVKLLGENAKEAQA